MREKGETFAYVYWGNSLIKDFNAFLLQTNTKA